MPPDLAIEVTDLTKTYAKNNALNKISLSIPRGKIYGVLGPNGAGKSTLIKTLVGVIKSTQGRVRVLSLDPIEDATLLYPQIGYMAQSPALYEVLTARDNIEFFAGSYKIKDAKDRINEVLESVGLSEKQNQPVYSLSGGMKQRVSLACAMVHKPALLLLDEPTAGIDPELKEELWQHFRKLVQGGSTLVLSTHLMDEALLCDELTILRAGEVVASSTPDDLMQKGHTQVIVEEGSKQESFTISAYYQQLPILLRKFGLKESISAIKLKSDSLEKIILELIQAKR